VEQAHLKVWKAHLKVEQVKVKVEQAHLKVWKAHLKVELVKVKVEQSDYLHNPYL
jgi:hypothetical protein